MRILYTDLFFFVFVSIEEWTFSKWTQISILSFEIVLYWLDFYETYRKMRVSKLNPIKNVFTL